MEARSFPAGLLGTYYAARQSLGHYLSCAVTGSYSFSAPESQTFQESFIKLLQVALRKTIERHPALCYGITDKSAEVEAHFYRIPEIAWDAVTQVHTSKSLPNEEDIALSKQLETSHDLRFSDQHRTPGWKLVVLFHEGTTRVDLSFITHHAISDGISATVFHRTLFENLDLASTQTDIDTAWFPYSVPHDIPRPVFIEDACPLSSKPLEIQPKNAPPPFGFKAPLPYIPPTRISILSIPPTSLPPLLTHCRSQTPPQTITSLLHGLIVLYLCRNLSITLTDTTNFVAVTPFSMRRFSHITSNEIVNHISSITSTWDSSVLALARTSTDNSPEEAKVMALISSQYTADINAELAAVPISGTKSLRVAAGITDWVKESKRAEKEPRKYTYEVSNVGKVEIPKRVGNKITLDKLVFTQCGMYVGPAIGCSTVSLGGGPLCIGFCWQEGVVGTDVVEGLKRFLEERLLNIGGLI